MPRKSTVTSDDVFALSQKGFTHAEIAKTLGISIPTVCRRLRAHTGNTPTPPPEKKTTTTKAPNKPDVDTEDILDLRQKGFSAARIAKMLNISVSTVHKRIQAYNVGPVEPKKDVTAEEIVELREKGLSNYKIAMKFGVSEFTIRTRLKKAEKIESSTPPEAEKAPQIAPEPETPKKPEKEALPPAPITQIAPTPKKREEIPTGLLEFAYFPDLYNFYDQIIRAAMPEPWKFKNDSEPTNYPGIAVLVGYINRIFRERALDYNTCPDEDADKVILFRKDACYIHTGLYTPEFKGIYLHFERNRAPYAKVPWYSRNIKNANTLTVSGVFPLPEHRSLRPAESKQFNPDLPIIANTDHILKKPENLKRLPESVRNAWNLLLLFETSVELSRRMARITPHIVVQVCQIERTCYLLPLYLTNPVKPDVVAVLDDMGDYYFCRTCLTPEMAYLSARINGRPTVDWLTELVEYEK